MNKFLTAFSNELRFPLITGFKGEGENGNSHSMKEVP
jgi:hypothetical protein